MSRTQQLLFLLILSACGPTSTPDAPHSVTGEVVGVPTDHDRDGIPDVDDRCPTVHWSAGTGVDIRPRVDATGCPEVTMPRECKNDVAAPGAIFGLKGGKNFIAGATVRKTTLDGRTVLALRIESAQDLDILDACPAIDAHLLAVVRVGDAYRHALCPARVTPTAKDLGNGPELVRELSIDDRNPCFFDPATHGLGEAAVQSALAAGTVEVVLKLFVRDAAMNQLTTNLGEGAIGAGACGFTTTRTGYQQLAPVVPIPCSNPCGAGPALQVGAGSASFPAYYAGTSGGKTVVFKPEVVFSQPLQVISPASCPPPVITAFARTIRVGEQLLVDDDPPLACAVGGGPNAYAVSCTVKPNKVTFTGADGLRAELDLLVRSGDRAVTGHASIAAPLP